MTPTCTTVDSVVPQMETMTFKLAFLFYLGLLRPIWAAMEDHMHDFAPLDCNFDIETRHCRAWSRMFGTGPNFDNIVIPCGGCVRMDLDHTTIYIHRGLDIQGKLTMYNVQNLTIVTPMVVVQGHWYANATTAVTGNPNIRFLMTGEDEDQEFVAIDNNAHLCAMGLCKAGKKSITVAGGQVNLHGLPPDTPTWMQLYDVTYSEEKVDWPLSDYQPYEPISCPDHFFDLSDEAVVLGTLGSNTVRLENELATLNRTALYHAPLFDLRKVRSCLELDRVYLITARVRLEREGGGLTTCALTDKFCLELEFDFMEETERRRTTRLWMESPARQLQYGSTFTIAVEHTFTEEELNSSNVFQALRFYGLEPGIDVFVEDISIGIPPPVVFYTPSNACRNLVPGNGDAEDLGWSHFPFETNRNWAEVFVEEEVCGNRFFRVSGRSYRASVDPSGTSPFAGLTWSIPVDCIQPNALLQFGANFRPTKSSRDPGPFAFNARLRVEYADGATEVELASCSYLPGDEWSACSGSAAIPPDIMSRQVLQYWVRLYTDSETFDYDVDDLSLEVVAGSPTGLILDEEILGKWESGSEILITSHTMEWNGHQVRKIVDIGPHDISGFAVLQLDSSFPLPTTLLDSPSFAVEVALLSRNIVFEGGEDTRSHHGGHFWVKHTPNLVQTIEGVEIRNFGQQGNLGRYPLHFHLCGDQTGSSVLKNTVRQSNQRCYVVHGTDNLLVKDNVAYDTKGHCFIVEDGVETGNEFNRNLAAQTDAVDRLIPNRDETDNLPSSFWITNPNNKWVENVAAGSQFSGYWIEPLIRGPKAYLFEGQNPREQPLGLFHGNKAHSNGDHGFRSYPSGYIPLHEAVFSELISYRNKGDGVFFHNSINLALVDSLLADNEKQIDIDRAENIRLENTQIVGQSQILRELIKKQGIEGNCRYSGIVGLELHTFSRFAGDNGPSIRNVTFTDFEGISCSKAVPISYDDEVRLGVFDAFATVKDVSFDVNDGIMDFCVAKTAGITGVYLSDLDGSVAPFQSSGPGTAMIDTPDMLHFVDRSKCEDISSNCYTYCENTCLRSIRYEVDPAENDYKFLRACSQTGSCLQLSGVSGSDYDIPRSSDARLYIAHLPPGEYTIDFVDSSGTLHWPTFVKVTFEERICPTAIGEESIQLVEPSIDAGMCTDLIRNGGFESSDSEPLYWLHQGGGVILLPGQGKTRNALGSIEYESERDGIVQYLDSRCLKALVGQWVEVVSWVKVQDKDGRTIDCAINDSSCANVILSGPSWSLQIASAVATLPPLDGFQPFHGTVQITDDMASSSPVQIAFRPTKVGSLLVLDDVSMTPLPDSISSCPLNFVYNGELGQDDARFWDYVDGTTEVVDLGGSTLAVRMENGLSRPRVRPHCFVEGERYEFSAKFRMTDSRGRDIACGTAGLPDCPRAQLFGWLMGERVATENIGWIRGKQSDWKEIYGVFTATSELTMADNLAINFRDVPSGSIFTVSDVSISFASQDCSNMIINSDLEDGYMGFWQNVGDGLLSNFSPGHESNTSVLYTGRTVPRNGPQYNLETYADRRCFQPGATYEVTAWVQLITGASPLAYILCNTKIEGHCPQIFLRIKDNTNRVVFAETKSYYANEWVAPDFNELKATFTLPNSSEWDGSITDLFISIRDGESSNILFDDFTMRKID